MNHLITGIGEIPAFFTPKGMTIKESVPRSDFTNKERLEIYSYLHVLHF
jgi:hypothetical protein